MLSSTPVRKSFMKRKEDQVNITPIVESTTDDERQKRRSVYDVEHKLSRIPESSSCTMENFDQIKNHLTMCQKLFNENKINIHNAWNVKVIDYMEQYISKNKIDSETMLIGARTLEVCVKVYGCKVDYLSQEVMRLANNMASEKNKNNADPVVEDDLAEDQAVGENKAKTKKRKRITRATVVKDKKGFTLTGIPKITSVDFVGNIRLDATNFDNMAINKIPMDHALYTFNLSNNTDRGFLSYDMEDSINQEVMLKTVPSIRPFIICPEFKNFNVDEEDNDYNDSIASVLNNSQSRLHSLVGTEIAYDENGLPIPELDGSMHDIFAENDNNLEVSIEEVNGVVAQTNQKRIEKITSFCPILHSPQKYNINNTSSANSFLETVWVGPSHWKNKLIRPSAPRYSGKPDKRITQAKERRAEGRKEIQNLLLNFDDTVEINLEQKYKRKLGSYSIKKCTLPTNAFILPEFDKLMLVNLIPMHEYIQNRAESDFEHSPYNYNNADDSQYCSQVDLIEPGDDPHDNVENNIPESENDVPHEDNAENILNENNDDLPPCLNTTDALINAPDLVTQTYCPYALRAKNVNMKKLKSAMLDCLTNDHNESIDINKVKIDPILFSEVFRKLPLMLPKKQRSGLSVPLAYFTLLHLTNEYALNLNQSSLKDIKIEKL